MSTPDGPRPRWPLRTIGFVLLQLAAVAAVVGLVTVATGADSGPAQGQPSAGRGSVDSPAGTTTSPPPTSSPSPLPTLPPAAPPPATTAKPVPAPPPAPAPRPAGNDAAPGVRDVRVFNNSMIHGLADRAANDFRAAGWRVVQVGNYAASIIPTSTVYYDVGQRASAEALAREFGMQVRPRFPGMAGGAPGLVVIVTKDYRAAKAGEQGK